MNYTIALSIAAKAATYLQEKEGSMSETEIVVHISALHLALQEIAKHNCLEDLDATTKAKKEGAGLGIAGSNVRFFCQVRDDLNGGADVAEIDESTFVSLGGCVTYHRTTIKDHGCHQIGLTTDATLGE